MYKGGRRKDPIWECFEEVSVDGKAAAKCKKCGRVQSNKAARMKTHVSQCVTKASRSAEIVPLSRSTSLNSECSEEVDEPFLPPKKVMCLGSVNKFLTKTTTEDKKKIDVMVAKLFYACNIPYAVVESEAFKNLIHILRPGYKSPSRTELSGVLLDAVYDEMQQLAKEKLKGKEGTLVIDGWSNIHNEPIIASCVQVEGKSYVVDVEATAATKKTAEFLTEKCNKVIATVQSNYDCEIKSIVTDNAKNMEKMRCELERQNKNRLISYGCGAHWLNLLGEDITPSVLIKHIVEIHKYFRNHHAPGSWLKECSGHVSPQLPGNTRWNSQLTCLETFVHNHSFYIKIANEHLEEMDQTIITRIRDFNLYHQVKDLIKQLKPVSSALDVLQSDSSTLADACHIWCNLLKNEDLKPHVSKAKRRFEQAILPCHFAAYLLHPKYKGELLNYEQKENAKNWLGEINPSFLPMTINFELQEKPFPTSYFKEEVTSTIAAHKWWKSVSNACEISKDFCNLISHLQTCPSSSATIERLFSNFAYVHSKVRNRLLNENVSKLVFCYTMLKQQNLGWND